jgi:hypothetical protein
MTKGPRQHSLSSKHSDYSQWLPSSCHDISRYWSLEYCYYHSGPPLARQNSSSAFRLRPIVLVKNLAKSTSDFLDPTSIMNRLWTPPELFLFTLDWMALHLLLCAKFLASLKEMPSRLVYRSLTKNARVSNSAIYLSVEKLRGAKAESTATESPAVSEQTISKSFAAQRQRAA